MLVKAKPGAKCPKEGKPREYISDSEPVEVPASAYYNRLIKDGSLVSGIVGASGARPEPEVKKKEKEVANGK